MYTLFKCMRKLNSADKLAKKLVNAFLKGRVIKSLPLRYTKNIKNAQKFRKLCESKIKSPIVGFKAAGTAFPVLKKLGEKEPFYASVYERNFLKNKSKIKINKYTMGIELEVCYLIKKEILNSKEIITLKNIGKYISQFAPCIEVVGYRQKKKGIKYLGDLCSDFGANVKFVIGPKKKYIKINTSNLKTNISNKKQGQSIDGNTNTVYVNPLNSLKFVINKLKKDKISLKKNFYVFTGSTVGVVPIYIGVYSGKVEKIGLVSSKII